MSWVSLALAIVKLANLIFSTVERRALEQAGENREKLREFHEMQTVSRLLAESDARYAKLSDAEIKADIEAQGDFRE